MPSPIVCNLAAIDPSARDRYHALRNRIREAVRNRSDLADGFAFRLDESTVPLTDVAEWVDMERRCCPFLTIQISVTGGEPGWVLSLTGPAGTKAILAEAFV
jgi:hypothetical protein